MFLLVADALLGGTPLFVFATFMSLCAVGGPVFCELGTPTAALLTYAWFGLHGQPVEVALPGLIAMLAAYLVSGLVLGSSYDALAGHRTFLILPTVRS